MELLNESEPTQSIAKGGQTISCVKLLDSMLQRNDKNYAKELPDNLELSQLFEQADSECERVKHCGGEYYLAVFNPSFIVLHSEAVARIMMSLGSAKSITGEWTPVIVKHHFSFYRIWGKTSFCG